MLRTYRLPEPGLRATHDRQSWQVFRRLFAAAPAGNRSRFRRRFRQLFLEPLEERTLPSASILGSVWNDLAGSGVRQGSDPAAAGQVVYLDLNHDGKLDSAVTPETPSSTAITAAGAGVLGAYGLFGSSVQVQNLPNQIQDLAVNLDLTNNSPDAIQLGLISPLGFTVPNLPGLFVIQPGQTFDGIIDGNSTNPITLAPNLNQAGSTITGTYAPQQSFASPGNYIYNSSANGTWALIFFASPSDVPELQLNSWSLAFTSSEPSTTTDAAGNYSFTGLAAGTYQVSLANSSADVVTYPAGGVASQTVTVADGQTLNGVDFGIQPASDLTSKYFALTAPATGWGQNVTVNYTLTNQGAGAAPAFDVGLYLSANGDITTGGTPLDTLHVNGLAAGASTSGSVTVTLPAAPPTGFGSVSSSYVGFVIDPADSVRDASRSDKSNQGSGIDLALLGAPLNPTIAAGSGVQQDPSIAVDPTNANHLVAAYMDYSLLTTGYAGIAVAVSEDAGKNWTTSTSPISLPAGFDQGAAAPTVIFDAEGNVYISFMAATFLGTQPTLTNLDTSQLSDGFTSNNGIFVAKSGDGGLTWSTPVAVVSNIDSGTPVNFTAWPSLAVDTYATLPNGGGPNPSYGKVYVTWTQYYAPGQFPGDPGSSKGSAIMIATSSDGGASFQTQMQNVPGTGPATGLVSAILDPQFGANDTGIQDRFSTVTTGPGQAVYISSYAGAYFIVYASTDGGQSTGTPGNLVSGFTAPNYGAATGLPFGAGVLVAVPGALYGGAFGDDFRTLALRQVVADPTRPGVVYALAPNDALDFGTPPLVGAQGIVFAVSYDYGQDWSSNFTVGNEANIVATLNTSQDATYAPVLNDDNGGFFPGYASSLTNQVYSGQAMPTMTVDAKGDIVVTWYDTRSDPSEQDLQVWSTVSTDGGLHFSANFPVSDAAFNPNAGAFTAGNGQTTDYLGDQIGVVAADGTAYAVWTGTNSGTQQVYFGSYALTPTPAQPTDRFSPNNTPQTATNLGTVTAQDVVPELTLPPGSSDEWFSLQTGASGVLSVSVTAALGGQNLQLTLTDASGNVLPATITNVVDASGAVIGEALVYPSVAGQTYLVHVSAQSDVAIDYTLTAGALTADLGTALEGSRPDTLAAGGVNDYRLTAAVTGSFVVTLSASADVQSAGLTLAILSADGQTVLAPGPAAGAAAGTSEQVTLSVTAGQVVLLQVSGLDANSQGDFTLQFANLDQFETSGATTLFFPTQGDPSSIAAADLSGNGRMDLLVTNTDASDTLGVLQSNSDGTFQAEQQDAIGPGLSSGILGAGPRQIAVANLTTGSTIPDVIVPNFRAADVSVLIGNGDGTLQPQRNFDAVTSPASVITGDLNGDGNTDAIVMQTPIQGKGAEFAVLMGNGDGTFQPPVFYQTVFAHGSNTMVLGHFTTNGILDLVVFNANAAEGQIFYGNGDGTFRNGGTFATGEDVANAAAADLTGDGKFDLITTGVNTGNVYVMLGNGDGTFQTPVAYTALAPKPGDFVAVNGLVVTNFGNSSPSDPLNIVVTAQSRTGAGPAEVIELPGLGGGQFGAPVVLATVGTAGQIVAGDFSGDGTTDLAVADKGGVTVIYGAPLALPANTTLGAARDLGTVVNGSTLPQAIVAAQAGVADHENAYFTATVPAEAATGSGDELVEVSAAYQDTAGGGLSLTVLDGLGNPLPAAQVLQHTSNASGDDYILQVPQGVKLTLLVSGGSGGIGVYTLDIEVLPQVIAAQAESPIPGGPATSIVLTFQGDRLDLATAALPGNYTVTFNGGSGDRVIPLSTAANAVVYDPGANLDVVSGLHYATAVRQTVTLLFDQPLPAGDYTITVSPNVLSAGGHSVESVVSGSPTEGAQLSALGLVAPTGTPGDLSQFAQGTPFLTQLQNDLNILLDQQLAQNGDAPSITGALNQEILARFAALYAQQGVAAASLPSFLIYWFDPVSINVVAPQAQTMSYNLAKDGPPTGNLADTYVNVSGNVELVVMANASGSYQLSVADVPAEARGGAVILSQATSQVLSFTDDLRAGQESFTLDLGGSPTVASTSSGTATGSGSGSNAATSLALGESGGNNSFTPTAALLASILLTGVPPEAAPSGSGSAGAGSAATVGGGPGGDLSNSLDVMRAAVDRVMQEWGSGLAGMSKGAWDAVAGSPLVKVVEEAVWEDWLKDLMGAGISAVSGVAAKLGMKPGVIPAGNGRAPKAVPAPQPNQGKAAPNAKPDLGQVRDEVHPPADWRGSDFWGLALFLAGAYHAGWRDTTASSRKRKKDRPE